MEMSEKRQETIDDIVKEIRGNAEHNHALVEVSKYLTEIADRIEAALKREKEKPVRNCDKYKTAWRLFYSYLYAYLYGFKIAKVTLGGKSGFVEVFRADGKWYAREGYEKFGKNVAAYNDSEIEF